jgi:hypothetical protein
MVGSQLRSKLQGRFQELKMLHVELLLLILMVLLVVFLLLLLLMCHSLCRLLLAYRWQRHERAQPGFATIRAEGTTL